MENDDAFHGNSQIMRKVASSSSFLNEEGGANVQKTVMEESSKKPQCSPRICSKSSATSKSVPYGNANQESSESYLSEASNKSQDTSPRSSMDNALKSEKAFIEYVMSLPTVPLSPKDTPHYSKIEASPSSKTKHKSCSVVSTTTNATKVGLDHLDNLCKLMEQLSELKETNTKLQKRVQYLEDLKTLHEMHKEIRREVQYGSENVLSQRRQHMCLKKSLTSSDYVRESPSGSKDYVPCLPRGSADYFFQEPLSIRNSRSPSGRRSRTNNSSQYEGLRRERSKSVGHEEVYDSKSKRIFPKWSKVKEALGWESERKDSTKATKFNFNTNATKTSNEEEYFSENRRILTDNDIAVLRIPIYSEYCEKDYAYPTDSYAGEAMATCGETYTVPYNSSAEDINRFPDGFYTGRKLKPKSLTIERGMDAEQAFAKFEKEDSKKSHKSPWGRVKTIIEKRRDSLKRRTMRRVPESITPAARSQDLSHIGDLENQTETACRYDFRRKSSDDQLLPNSILSKVEGRQYSEIDKIYKRKKQATADQGKEDDRDRTRKAPSPLLHINPMDHFEPQDTRVQNSDREVGFRTPGSSPQFHRKSTWMKMKDVLRSKKEEGVHGASSQSMPSSPNGVHDGHFDFEDSETLGGTPEELECYEDGHEITRVGSDSFVHKLSGSAPVSDIMLELQRNISEDFTRKMEEWERIRNSGIRPITSPKWERKNSSTKTRKKSEKQKTERYEKSSKPKVKDLTWLEKELQKIEKEKQRLSREKEKYEERAVRLERLRQTVLAAKNSNKKEVLVRTSAGEFRFEGISDAFTKKLYEWETKRGVGPELSTIALLDSSLGPNKNSLTIQQVDKTGNLHRGLSRSESSMVEIGQHSQTSSNSLPSLKPTNVECGDPLIGIHQYSRSNSEPDLFSFMNKPNNNQNRLSKQNNSGIEDTAEILDRDLRDPYVHPEVTQLIDSDADETMCDDDGRQEQRDENYYSLLEENVILLEQLKSKEEICKRLEKELKLLDEKVEEMNKHHQQEMEKYREKLWEMHKPGNTPREVQGCLQVMVELRSRIENLENCSEKLKTEKETLEDSFRFHSAEQEHMTLDLLDKMRELQEAGSDPQKDRNIMSRRELPQPNFDLKIVERLQDLSSQLVKQTRELEHALAERTQQICQLRWELLHRDVSTVKLETELHSAHIQGNSSQNRSKCDEKRTKYAHFRSWSSEEASKSAPKECKVTDHLRPSEFQDTYYKQPETKFQASKLTDTIHELNRELIRLSSAAESLLGGQEIEQEKLTKVAEKENDANSKALKLQQTTDAEDSLLCSSSEASSCDIFSMQKNKTGVSQISVRRNSVGSISMASGRELSESSSINNDKRKCFPILKASPKLKQNIESSTSSSDSDSITEESFVKGFFNPKPSTIGEVILKQIKKIKTNHDTVSENSKSSSPIRELKYSQQGLKKRSNYKGIKIIRKSNNHSGQSVSPLCSSHIDDKIHKYHTVMQSESDTAINNQCFKYGDVGIGEKAKSEVNPRFLRLCQSADQVMVRRKEILKNSIKGNANTYTALSKETMLPTSQNYSSRGIEHSKSEKSHYRSNIRKSESLMNPINNAFEMHEAKRSKSMKIYKDVLAPLKFQEIDKTRSSSFRKKNRSGKTKETLKISTVLKGSIIPNSSIEYGTSPVVAETLHYNPVDADTRKFPHIDPTRTGSTLKAEIKSMPYIPLKQQLFISEPHDDIQNNDLIKSSNQSKAENNSFTQNQIPTSMVEFRENHPSIFVANLHKRKIKGSKINNSLVKPEQGDYNNKSIEDRVNIIPSKIFSNPLNQIENSTKNNAGITNNVNKNILLDTSTSFYINNDTSLDVKQPNEAAGAYIIDLPCRENLKNARVLKHCNKSNDTSYCETETKNILHDYQMPNDSMNEKISNDSTNIIQNMQEIKIIKNAIESQYPHHLQVKECSITHCQDTLGHNKEMINNCRKSPSAPQLDWTKTCAKKLSREGAPNVKTLIDKYNQKVMENQSKGNIHSSAYNSPLTARKISAPLERNYSHTHIPCTFSSTPNSPRIISSSVYNPTVWKPNIHISYNPLISPPTSPSSKARSIALQKAKEKFISTSSITHYVPENSTQKAIKIESPDFPKTSMQVFSSKLNMPTEAITVQNNAKKLVADSNLPVQRFQTENLSNEKSNNRKSICSTRSIDSMSFVMYKTGETCQESRLLKRNEKQKSGSSQPKIEETIVKPSKSLSNSSIFKTIKGPDIKFPGSFLRLRRSQRKKDMVTVSQLCRQSLLISGESSAAQADQSIISKSPRSCPSSPELKSKSKVKGSWLQRNIFWHK